MKVILLQDVKSLGKKGEIVNVSDGYARNFVLPKKLGVEANTSNMNDLKLQKANADKVAQEQLEAAQARVTNKQRMERELKALFEKDPDPLSLAPYDNLQPVMVELHRVLSAAQDYSLAFSTVETEETIVRRSISLSFTSGSYSAAKDILKELHDGMYRCLLSDLSITIGQEATNGLTTVSGTIVFFEYQVEG